MSRIAILAGWAAAFLGGEALAQTVPPAPPSAPAAPLPASIPAPTGAVVVTAPRPLVVNDVDRTIYNVSDDPFSQTGTAADLLRNLPQVDVDLDGNPSLRGDANVQILLNGQPSALLNGANRAAILQSMDASTIDSIEVMTVPSAMFRPDGSAGVINIVTKKGFKLGAVGTVRANVGSEGRYNAGANGSTQVAGVDVNAGFNLRQDVRKQRSLTSRDDLNAATGEATDSLQTVTTGGPRLSEGVWGGDERDVGESDHLSLDLSADARRSSSLSFEHDLAPLTPSDETRTGTSENHGWDEELDARYTHEFGGEDHKFTLRLQASRDDEDSLDDYLYAYALPPGPPSAGDQTSASREIQEQLTAEYVRPLAQGAKLQAGYSLERDDNLYGNGADGIDPASGLRTPLPAMTDDFTFGQWIHALYGTYQRSFGKLQVQAGLRLEDVVIDIRPQSAPGVAHTGYVRLYPSLETLYPLSDTSSLKGGYSLRVDRPSPDDLNPFVVVEDPFDESAGNPHLTPQETHDVEFGWQRNTAKSNLSITAYLRQTEGALTDVQTQVSPTVLLSSKINAGGLRSTGIDAFANGKTAMDKLSYSLSAYMFDNQVRSATGWYAGPRLDFGYSAKLVLNWRPTGQDLVQWTGNYASRRLTGQGYQEAGASADLGYRHDLTSRLTAVLTLGDMFDSRRQKTVVDVLDEHDVYERDPLGRTLMVGLSYRIGGGGQKRPQQDEKFGY